LLQGFLTGWLQNGEPPAGEKEEVKESIRSAFFFLGSAQLPNTTLKRQLSVKSYTFGVVQGAPAQSSATIDSGYTQETTPAAQLDVEINCINFIAIVGI